jgi:proline iminopeptidase
VSAPPDAPSPALRSLFPQPAPFQAETFPVGDGHLLSVRQYGHAAGQPVLVLHGGPGSGASPLLARFFDPARFRVILVDQRGAGLSQPAGALEANTTAHLVGDLCRLRRHLRLERWLVAGGSWGATLALAYTLDDAKAVSGLLLRSMFLARHGDIVSFFDGAARGRPAVWQRLVAEAMRSQAHATPAASPDAGHVPVAGLLEGLAAQLGSPEAAERERAALAWRAWEQWLSDPAAGLSTAGTGGTTHADGKDGTGATGATDATDTTDAKGASTAPDVAALVQRYRVQAHYLRHGCWLNGPDLLARCSRLPQVPTLLLHGTGDRICPPAGAAALAERLPHARLGWVQGAGHDPTHPAMIDAMVAATQLFAQTGALHR